MVENRENKHKKMGETGLKPEDKNVEREESALEINPVELKKVKEAIQSFTKAFTLIKMYPGDNPSVKKGISLFVKKMKEFLDEYEELKISIDEFSFSYEGAIVFQDEEKKKSLPFLFYKDGMRELSFQDGIEEEELQDFIETLKIYSELPSEESDIVNALWEKDYPHINYFALDEFLDSDIGGAEEGDGYIIDKQSLVNGAISLTSEDMREIQKRKQTLGILREDEKEKEQKSSSDSSLVSQLASINEGEIPELENMLLSSREPSRLAELVTLLFEILFLEEKEEQFTATLNVLEQCYHEILHKADFTLASMILRRLEELMEMQSVEDGRKCEELKSFYAKLRSEEVLSLLREIFIHNRVVDFESFFDYLRLFGPKSIPFIGDIWSQIKDPFVLSKAKDFLHQRGKDDLEALMEITNEEDVSLAREVIKILTSIHKPEIIPHLEKLATYPERKVRLDAIQTLGKLEDDGANKIFLRFIDDSDEEVRTVALMNLRATGDREVFDSVMKIALEKEFHKKRITEKKAILNFLARSKREEAYNFFRSMMKKSSLLTKCKIDETKLCIVSALEMVPTPETKDIFAQGAKSKNRVLSRACKLALRKISSKVEPYSGAKGEFRV